MATLAGINVINYDKTMEMGRKEFFGCSRKTHGPELCEEGCQFVIREQQKRNNGQWPPTKYPKGTFLSLPRNVEPPLTCYYGPLTLKSLASQTSPCYRNSVITEGSTWSGFDDESYYYELPKWLVGRNPKHEVPRDFMKGTTACKEATEAGHSPLWWLAPAKVIEAGKSAEDLSEEISEEHEIGSSKMSSSCKRDDYSGEGKLDAKEMTKRMVSPNPNHEVPSDFMKGTTACKEATEGHLQEARLQWLAPAKVIEAGKSAEDPSEEISKEHEIGSSKMRSSSKRDDYSANDGLDAKEMMKLGTAKRNISKRKRSKRKRISCFDDERSMKRIMMIRWPMLFY